MQPQLLGGGAMDPRDKGDWPASHPKALWFGGCHGYS